MPYPSTLQAVREFRHQMLLEDAARERRTASVIELDKSQEGSMFRECHHDWVIQRGIDEALACRDMLARDPDQPSLIVRLIAQLAAITNLPAPRKPTSEESVPHVIASSTNPHHT
jgi:hypothetical protein